jgi:hypothetical protein
MILLGEVTLERHGFRTGHDRHGDGGDTAHSLHTDKEAKTE